MKAKIDLPAARVGAKPANAVAYSKAASIRGREPKSKSRALEPKTGSDKSKPKNILKTYSGRVNHELRNLTKPEERETSKRKVVKDNLLQ
jgi:hypothetical protein